MDEISYLDTLQKVYSKKISLGKTLDPGQYSDNYVKELEKIIEAKSKGQEVVPKQEEEEPEDKGGANRGS